MEYNFLSKNVLLKTVEETESNGVFEISGLYTGYGVTIGNAFRRILLSSLPGAAITQVKIKGVKHEFSTIDGVLEDVIDITLNLKKIKFKFFADEPQVLTLKAKGQGEVYAKEIKINSEVELMTPDVLIATLTSKAAELDMEITVEKGLGYSPAESRRLEKLPIGSIAIDAVFTPVTMVNYEVESMRVGERTDFNKLILMIETDGTITPSSALHKASNILKDHIEVISGIDIKSFQIEKEGTPKSKKEEKPTIKTKKTTKKK